VGVESVRGAVANDFADDGFCEVASNQDRCGIGDLAQNLAPGVDADMLIGIGKSSPFGVGDLTRVVETVTGNDGLLTV
jgi:hypothetical protein